MKQVTVSWGILVAMARIFYVHWNKEEVLESVRALREAGHTVGYPWCRSNLLPLTAGHDGGPIGCYVWARR